MNEIIYYIFHYGPCLLVGLVVWYLMRVKYTDEIRIATLEAYHKGQEDYRKMIPEQEEDLRKLRQEYSDAFSKNWEKHEKEYQIGLIDGSKFIYETYSLGEYTKDVGVNVLSSNVYNPHKTYLPIHSDYYDEIINDFKYK